MYAISLPALTVFIISFILSLAAVAIVLRLSNRKKWFDPTDDRKIHRGNIPRLGGIGFALAFMLVALGVSIVTPGYESNLRYVPCFIALLVILVFGVYDDFRPLAPRYKLIVQVVAALIVIIPGFAFRRIAYIGADILPGPLGFIITLFWIVGLTNAVNLIDGLDGLAGGVSGIIAVFLGLIFFFFGSNTQLVLFCAAFVGVILGFLVFNAPLPKAKIFMGDCGSQFLGFLLALLPLLEHANYPAALPVLYAAALLLIPILDTVAAVWRRIRDKKGISVPDMSHVHHKLMNLGLSVRGVNTVLCGLQILLGALVFISIRLSGMASLYVLGIAYIIGTAFFSTVHFMNRAANKAKNK